MVKLIDLQRLYKFLLKLFNVFIAKDELKDELENELKTINGESLVGDGDITIKSEEETIYQIKAPDFDADIPYKNISSKLDDLTTDGIYKVECEYESDGFSIDTKKVVKYSGFIYVDTYNPISIGMVCTQTLVLFTPNLRVYKRSGGVGQLKPGEQITISFGSKPLTLVVNLDKEKEELNKQFEEQTKINTKIFRRLETFEEERYPISTIDVWKNDFEECYGGIAIYKKDLTNDGKTFTKQEGGIQPELGDCLLFLELSDVKEIKSYVAMASVVSEDATTITLSKSIENEITNKSACIYRLKM